MIKFMRMIVMFDLPTLTAKDRKIANKFRNFLVKDGYHMMQLSNYVRVCNGNDDIEKHKIRLKANIPEHGSVRMLIITEKQFNSISILVGEKSKGDLDQKATQLSFF